LIDCYSNVTRVALSEGVEFVGLEVLKDGEELNERLIQIRPDFFLGRGESVVIGVTEA